MLDRDISLFVILHLSQSEIFDIVILTRLLKSMRSVSLCIITKNQSLCIILTNIFGEAIIIILK